MLKILKLFLNYLNRIMIAVLPKKKYTKWEASLRIIINTQTLNSHNTENYTKAV